MRDAASPARTPRAGSRPAAPLIILLSLGVYALHFPGQATYDTLAQAYDGATGIYTSNQPPAMSLLLSALTLPGVLALQITLFAAATWRLVVVTGGSARAQYGVVIALFLYPVVLLYTGIVWKDVLFAHGAVLALLLLPANSQSKHWSSVAISAALLAAAVAVRQQAVIVAVCAVLYLLFGAGVAGLKLKARWLATGLWIALFALSSHGIRAAVDASGDTGGAVAYQGPIRQIAMFDLGGILSRVPELAFPAIAAGAMDVPIEHRPTRERVVAQLGRYSPERQDFMAEPEDQPLMWILPEVWLADWRTGVAKHPLAYLTHRMDATSWLLGFHNPNSCAPFAVGIYSTPEHMVSALGFPAGISRRAQALGNMGHASLPLFRPWLYIGLSALTVIYLLASGGRKHGPMIILQASGLLYAASYFFIGFACDFRYTYFTTIAALFGAAYAALSLNASRRA